MLGWEMRGKNGETDCLAAKREEADRGIALVRETGEIKNDCRARSSEEEKPGDDGNL